MLYQNNTLLHENRGNNAFSYDIRDQKYLTIPSLIKGSLDDVGMGDDIVFEEMEAGIMKSCRGLQHFVRIEESTIPITIFDNHNHALYFWLEAMREGTITPGCELIHIDEHSDLWTNPHILDRERAIRDAGYAWEFTNYDCNVGNYIQPVIDAGIIGNMIRIENEWALESYIQYKPEKNSILNIDLDFFSPEMDFIPDEKKRTFIQDLLPQVKCVTIATSPFFIDQGLAIKHLYEIFDHSMRKRKPNS